MQVSRRAFLGIGGAGLLAAASAPALKALAATEAAPGSVGSDGYLDPAQLATLRAAVDQLIPPGGTPSWSASEIGVVDYIQSLLSGFGFLDPATGAVYPSGPYRVASGPEVAAGPPYLEAGGPGFYRFAPLALVKAVGWRRQVREWQAAYDSGLADLDKQAGGGPAAFASAPPGEQLAILEALDYAGSPFFSTLFNHTMEGAYAHPVYGGNAGYAAWQAFGFGGDVHGVRFSPLDADWSEAAGWLPTTDPATGSPRGSWAIYGGYAPAEIATVGSASTEQPTTTPTPRTTHW